MAGPAPRPTGRAPAPPSRSIAAAAGLATVIAAVFLPSLSGGFVYDSRLQILADGFIHDSRNWPAVLSGRVLGMDVLDFNRPAMLASLMLDAAVWGREPFGYHLSSLVVHVVNGLLAWRFFDRFAGSGAGAAGRLAPLLGALLFAIHPIVAEAVCEPSCREDLLVVAFSLGALLLALGHDPAAERLDSWRVGACTVCCLFAVASKESGIVAPALLALLWRGWRRDDSGGFWPAVVVSSAVVAGGFLLLRLVLEPRPSAIFGPAQYPGGSLASALLLEPRILALYAQLILCPRNLSADYGVASLTHLPLGVSLGLLVIIGGAFAIGIRRDQRLLAAAALILLPLLPVLNLWPIYQPAADRYLYFPMVGVGLAGACLLEVLAGRAGRHAGWVLGAGVAVVVALGGACLARERVWHDPIALWSDTFRKNPGSSAAATGLGEAWFEAGRAAVAERWTREAIRLSGGAEGSQWATLAIILDSEGRAREAAACLARALALDPLLADPDGRVAALALEPAWAERLKRLQAAAAPAR